MLLVSDPNDEDLKSSSNDDVVAPVVNPQEPTPSPKKTTGGRNAALTALVGNFADSVSTAVSSIGLSVTGNEKTKVETTRPSVTTENDKEDANDGDGSDDMLPKCEDYKMDVQDFIEAVEIDDVLIQVCCSYC